MRLRRRSEAAPIRPPTAWPPNADDQPSSTSLRRRCRQPSTGRGDRRTSLVPAIPRRSPGSPSATAQSLSRHPDGRAQAAERAVGEGDVAAMGACDVARNGEAESRAAGVEIARLVKPQERLEDIFAAVAGNARTVIVDRDGEDARVMHGVDLD